MNEEQTEKMLSIACKYQKYVGQPVTDLAEYYPEEFHLMCKEVMMVVGDIND